MMTQLSTGHATTPILRTVGLTKQYSGITVVDSVNIEVVRGTIRGIIGENGAGKSTLVKMLAGDVTPSAGAIYLNEQPVVFDSPRAANLSGIAMVHQELQLVPMLSIIDNLMLVNPPDARRIRRRTRNEIDYVASQLARVGLKVSPKLPVTALTVAQAQLLEIAKALALNAKVLIFDEPTSALPPKEADHLLQLIEGLRTEGHAIIYISHHLAEVRQLADYITVMRDARAVGDVGRDEATEADLIRLMVDRPVSAYATNEIPIGQEVVFEADRVATDAVRDVSFTLRKGEILGFAGLMGSGMQEAASVLCGDVQVKSGSLFVRGERVVFKNPYDATRVGVVIIPEDRKLDGIVPDASLDDNFHIGRMQRFVSHGLLQRRVMLSASRKLAMQYGVHYHSLTQPIKSLSGGNQQKIIVGRCVQTHPDVLILCEPTRGIDVGAKGEIHEHILKLAAAGTAIILVSSELEEILALSHRVSVFCEGAMVGILDRQQANPISVMSLATPKSKVSNERNNHVSPSVPQ